MPRTSRRAAALGSMPAFSTNAEAASQAAESAAPTVQVESCGDRISAINIIPAQGFDPTQATPAQLELNGFPPQPVDAAELDVWERYVTSPIRRDASCDALSDGHPGSPAPAQTPATVAGYNSPNWAGNVAENKTYTNVQATWVVPLGVGDNGTWAYSSSWPGLGLGNSASRPLIQAGTESDGNDWAGANYYFWWEVYPILPYQKKIGTEPKHGDTVSVSVTASTTKATFQISDLSAGFSQTYSYTGSWTLDGHAEWILERTTINGHIPWLSDSPTTFRNAVASGSGFGSTGVGNLPHYFYNMWTCDLTTKMLAYPGPIGSDAKSFTAYWLAFGGPPGHRTC